MPSSGSALSEDGSVLRVLPESQETLVRYNKQGNIPRRHFEIEGMSSCVLHLMKISLLLLQK